MLKRTFQIASFSLAFASTCTFVSAEEVLIPTRFGQLSAETPGELKFKGKLVAPEVFVTSGAYVRDTYKLGPSDVVLVSQAAGNACPGKYSFVVVSAEGARATPAFGTCYDDDIKPVQIGETLAFSMKKLGGKGSVRYIYERGVIFENGKPLQ